MANFISITDLKSNQAIQGNVDSALLSPFINASQRMYILRILGTSQYEALENDINTYNISGLTGTSLALQQKIAKPLEYYTFYTAMPFLQTKITNKGIVQWEDATSKTVDESTFDKLRKEVLQWATYEENELLRFLRTNKTSYPLWREEYFSTYELNSGATYQRTYFGGIEFDKPTEWRRLPPDIL